MVNMRRQEFVQALPYARRYARALVGSQAQGDLLVAESLRDLVHHDDERLTARHSLYRGISRRFAPVGHQPANTLSALQRKLLLLTALEEVPTSSAANLLEIDPGRASSELAQSHHALRAVAQTDVLIIEDEPIIAMDIEELVQQCGHRVTGVAYTEADAVRLAEETRPGLILADISLGAGGDGINAVKRIMNGHKIPVIFVTAYPERLLTGETIEPPFVITKPFEPLTLSIATYQAVTGGVKLT